MISKSLSQSGLKLALASCLLISFCGNVLAADINADIWADNWYSLYQDGELVKEDPVKFNTERSFNSDSFSFSTDLPATFSIIIKDFYEDDSGFEYIGSRRQQMGDGGFRAQFFDAQTDQIIAVSDDSWRCTVIHQAPLNARQCANDTTTCESNIQVEPAGWKMADYDDSEWGPAIVHSAQAIRPHGGYRDVNWRNEAQLIWAEDLEVDNVLLCRFTIDAP